MPLPPNPTRYHDSQTLVHQSTGMMKFTQRRRTHRTKNTTVAPGNFGHESHDYNQDEIVEVTIDKATGGSFMLTVKTPDGVSNTTAPIAWNATPVQVKAAVELLANVGHDQTIVTGVPQDWTIEFTNGLAWQPVKVTGDGSALIPPPPASTFAVTEIKAGLSSPIVPLKNGIDDISETVVHEAEAPSLRTNGDTADRLISTGTVVPPVPPSGAEENTRAIWRDHTFSTGIRIN